METHYAAKTKIIEIETWLEGTLEELNKTNKSLKSYRAAANEGTLDTKLAFCI